MGNQIDKPNTHFNPVLYTGNGATNHAITGVGFQPDFTWVKRRSGAAEHKVNDVVRGAGLELSPDITNAELDRTYFLSFDTDGFTVNGTVSNYNGNGDTYASWNWKAGGTAVSNTDGSITSSVSANTDSGFSIVSYTGTGANATVGTGLGATPAMIIVKDRTSGTALWCVYHKSLGTNQNIYLNLTNTLDTPSPEIYRTASMTDNVFAIGSHGRINTSSNNYIAYCFAEKKGFSKFGSYDGNGNADGTFVYTGFKPAFVICKASSITGDWLTADIKRLPINVMNGSLAANLNNAESYFSGNNIDFLSNGFKLRTTGGVYNSSGASYIYMAFAENPLVGSNGIPTTAR